MQWHVMSMFPFCFKKIQGPPSATLIVQHRGPDPNLDVTPARVVPLDKEALPLAPNGGLRLKILNPSFFPISPSKTLGLVFVPFLGVEVQQTKLEYTNVAVVFECVLDNVFRHRQGKKQYRQKTI